ncbi:MAG: efflux RND transporter periplasmic adaptor subunit [Parvularculaceae bacterium]
MAHLDHHRDVFTTLRSIRAPRVVVVIALLLCAAAVIAAAFLAFTPWVQTTSGAGVVTALNPNDRLQQVNALVAGRIDEWYVRDGSIVKAGDPIVRIADNDPRLIERLEAERAQVVAKREAVLSARATAEVDLRRMQDLYKQGLAARREFEQAEIAVQNIRGRIAEVEAELNRVDVNISRQSAQIVVAPRDGVILRVNAGDSATFVDAGDAVASFVPTGIARAVEIYIDGRDVALVRPGARARLQFEGWPAVQFSGWPSVAVGTFAAEVVAVDPSADASGRFRVLMTEAKDTVNSQTPWPSDQYVRFGATAHGWILLDTVSVGYELWRQLNNFPPSMPGAGPATATQVQ